MKKIKIYKNLLFSAFLFTGLYSAHSQSYLVVQGDEVNVHDGKMVLYDTSLDNNGLISGTTSEVIFSGSQDATIEGSINSEFVDLTIDKTGSAKVDALRNLTCSKLTVNSDLNLDNSSTNTITVDSDLTVDSSADFTIGDEESLVVIDGAGLMSGNIIKKENSISRADEYDYTYWSSPVVGINLATIFTGVDNILEHDQSQSTAIDDSDSTYWDVWVDATGTMAAGKGYAAQGPSGTTGVHALDFEGVPNNGNISQVLKYNDDAETENDWNLLGNPYPSAIDIRKFFDEAGNAGKVDKVVYFWTHNTAAVGDEYNHDFTPSDYATYNYAGGTSTNPNNPGKIPSFNVGSGQGFFVRALSASTVTFRNTMRIADSNDQFFKSSNKKDNDEMDRVWLSLNTDQDGFNQILVAFTDKATDGFDNGYDAIKLDGGNTLNFYSHLDDDTYVIQGLSTFNEEKVVDLGFSTDASSENFTVRIDNVEGALENRDIYLVDHVLNITHNLSVSDYNFTQKEQGKFPNRFTLQFTGTALGVDNEVAANDFIISNSNNNIKVNSSYTVKNIKVYDVLGKLLHNVSPNQKSFDLETSDINSGTVVFIEALLENGAIVKRKTIQL